MFTPDKSALDRVLKSMAKINVPQGLPRQQNRGFQQGTTNRVWLGAENDALLSVEASDMLTNFMEINGFSSPSEAIIMLVSSSAPSSPEDKASELMATLKPKTVGKLRRKRAPSAEDILQKAREIFNS